MVKSKQLILCVSLLLSLVYGMVFSSAQENDPQPIAKDDLSFGFIGWLSNPLSLNYVKNITLYQAEDAGQVPVWEQYSPLTQQTQEILGTPMRSTLSESAQAQLDMARASSNVNVSPAAVYPSPDGRWLVYPSTHYVTAWKIAIADTQTMQHTLTESYIFNNELPPWRYRVLWSKQSNSFVVYSRGGAFDMPHTAFYVHNFVGDLSATQIQDLITGYQLGSSPWGFAMWEPYDLSADGRTVLALVTNRGDIVPNPAIKSRKSLALINALSPNQSRVIQPINGDRVFGATFAPNDDSKLLMVNEMGLVEYDIDTDTTTVIDGRVNLEWAKHVLDVSDNEVYTISHALFSPDGKWVAIHLGLQGGNSSLYVLPTGR